MWTAFIWLWTAINAGFLVKNLMNSQREEEFMQRGDILDLNKDFSIELVEILKKIPNHGLKSSSPHLCWALLVCQT
jgi:hypothetical protein